MKKREFQKKAAAALLGKLADVVMELEENPNITITSEYHSSYFKLRKNYNLIQISVKQTGELTYQLTDMLGNTGRSTMSIGTASTAIAPLQRSKSRASLQTLSRKWRNCSTPQNTVLMSKHRTPETIRTGTRNATAPQRICSKTNAPVQRKPSIRSERWTTMSRLMFY